MKSRTQLLTIVVLVLLAGALFAGAAFAQDEVTTPTAAPNMLQRMQERLGAEGWGQMIQRMTQRHGAEFTGEMLQRMAQQENCPCQDGATCEPGMGQGMMQHGRGGMHSGMQGGMQGGMQSGMMGRGMGGFDRQMGPRFWNNSPTEAPTTPTE
jgi:hypothetical protein